ncbi:hypothetical protein O988_04007 [Pseudogymnoascus sp. VKM F-3808]|nr:hypothetical protein O988_04007 [Pseudogymnoascus sp. VKM F-3808]
MNAAPRLVVGFVGYCDQGLLLNSEESNFGEGRLGRLWSDVRASADTGGSCSVQFTVFAQTLEWPWFPEFLCLFATNSGGGWEVVEMDMAANQNAPQFLKWARDYDVVLEGERAMEKILSGY